jgi:uncharacterized protein (DUF1499 family)
MRTMLTTILSTIVAVVALVMIALPGFLYQSGAIALGSAISIYRWAAYLGLATILLSVASGVLSFRRKSSSGKVLAVVSLVVGFVAFWMPYSQSRIAQSVPPIHDITTDTIDPPTFDAVLPLREGMNTVDYDPEVGAQQRAAYPEIVPLKLDLPLEQVFARALATAEATDWEIVAQDAAGGRIEATDTTRWMGFKDDVVIRLRPDGAGTRVDVRSLSRVGRSDIGTNARRIINYLRELQAGI